MVYGVLGRLLWRGGLAKARISIIHRGAPGNLKVIRGGDVTGVGKGYLTCKSGEGPDTVIPLHRVVEVRHGGKTVWKRAGKARV